MNHKFLHVLLIAEALDELLQLHNFFLPRQIYYVLLFYE